MNRSSPVLQGKDLPKPRPDDGNLQRHVCGRHVFFLRGWTTLARETLWLVFNDGFDNDVILLFFVWCFSLIYFLWDVYR